jgi:hypothetical protein
MAILVFIQEFFHRILALAARAPELMPFCRHGTIEHPILALIALWFSNPLVPDFGTQFLTALIIGLLLPSRIVNPIYQFIETKIIQKISILKKFEAGLYKHKRIKKIMKTKERVRTIIPRIIAGYVITYMVAYILLIYLCVVLR